MLVGSVVQLFTPHLRASVRQGTMPGTQELCNDMSASMKHRQFTLTVERIEVRSLIAIGLRLQYSNKIKQNQNLKEDTLVRYGPTKD